MVSDVKDQYVSAATSALGLVESASVARAWGRASALEGFTVGGLAGHIAAQVHSTRQALAGDFAGKDRIGLFEHFERAAWRGADLGNEANTRVREGGHELAEAGPEALITEARAALAVVETGLDGRDRHETSGNPAWAYATSLEDFLITRILEFVVHSDDLAYSVGEAMPVFETDVFDTAAWVLTRLASARHGQAALVRALSRAERAGADVTAL